MQPTCKDPLLFALLLQLVQQGQVWGGPSAAALQQPSWPCLACRAFCLQSSCLAPATTQLQLVMFQIEQRADHDNLEDCETMSVACGAEDYGLDKYVQEDQ